MRSGTRYALLAALAVSAVGLVWWAGDRTPPEIGWAAPPALDVAGEVRFEVIAVDHGTGLRRVWGMVDDRPPVDLDVVDGLAAFRLDTRSLPDGPHQVAIVARDRALWGNRAVVEANVRVDNTAPALTLVGGRPHAVQGRASALLVQADESLDEAKVVVRGQTWDLHRVGPDRYRALIGVGTDDTGTLALALRARDAAGNVTTVPVALPVEAGAFEDGGLVQLSDRQVAARRSGSAKVDSDVRNAVLSLGGPDALWSEPWEWPVDGQRTSSYGKRRRYSDGTSRSHGGLDLAAPEGTLVSAANHGVVTFAGEHAIYGLCVLVDHGHGVVTTYNHLSRVDVATEQVVRRGDPLGAVGSTGQSTGPHLHFEVVVAAVPVDPVAWYAEAPPAG